MIIARLLFTCAGSLGDLLPYASVAQRLWEQGHSITFAVEQRFATWLEPRGFATHVLDGDMIGTYLALASHLPTTTDALTSIQLLLDHYLLPTLPHRVEELLPLCEQADLLVRSTVQVAGAIAAEVTKTPLVSIALTPASIPDPALDPTPYRWPQLPLLRHLINRAGWRAGRLALRRVADVPLNRLRQQWELPPRQDLLLEGGLSSLLTAVAVSPAVLPPDVQWPAQVQTTGFCFWDDDVWEEPGDLTAFFAADGPVVAVALGSVSPTTGALLSSRFHACVAAIRQAGARALVIGAPRAALLPPDPGLLALDFAPHAAVFSRCAAVMHHGGMGTSAQAWRAGVPALVLPSGVDQFVTAALVHQLQVGTWQQSRHLHPSAIARQVQTLLTDTGIRQRAKTLGTHIRQEDGAALLAARIVACL